MAILNVLNRRKHSLRLQNAYRLSVSEASRLKTPYD